MRRCPQCSSASKPCNRCTILAMADEELRSRGHGPIPDGWTSSFRPQATEPTKAPKRLPPVCLVRAPWRPYPFVVPFAPTVVPPILDAEIVTE